MNFKKIVDTSFNFTGITFFSFYKAFYYKTNTNTILFR